MEEELSRIMYDVADLYQQQQSLDEFLTSGDLGCAAKVSPNDPGASGKDPAHLVCVCVDDFTDQADVWRVRESLRDMGFTRRLAFKADAYTHVGIYSGNERGISPSIYNA
ncbi:hypothetical protein Gpo141_00013267 [Globisporangium polare]